MTNYVERMASTSKALEVINLMIANAQFSTSGKEIYAEQNILAYIEQVSRISTWVETTAEIFSELESLVKLVDPSLVLSSDIPYWLDKVHIEVVHHMRLEISDLVDWLDWYIVDFNQYPECYGWDKGDVNLFHYPQESLKAVERYKDTINEILGFVCVRLLAIFKHDL